MADDPQVYVRHVRAAKICTGGSREWAASYDLSWSDFVKNGLPASVLEATGDPFALRAAAAAREEAANG